MDKPRNKTAMGARYLYLERRIYRSEIDFERERAKGFWVMILNIKTRLRIYKGIISKERIFEIPGRGRDAF